MVEGLPPTGALARAVAGHAWTQADWASADIRDLAELLLVAYARVHAKEGAPPIPWPERSWRPGDPLPETAAAADEERRARARATYERINEQVLPEKR